MDTLFITVLVIVINILFRVIDKFYNTINTITPPVIVHIPDKVKSISKMNNYPDQGNRNDILCVTYLSGLVEMLKVCELNQRIELYPSEYNVLFSKQQLENTMICDVDYKYFINYMNKNPTDYTIRDIIDLAEKNNIDKYVNNLSKVENINKLLFTMINNKNNITNFHSMYKIYFTFNTNVSALELAIVNGETSSVNYLINHQPMLCKYIK